MKPSLVSGRGKVIFPLDIIRWPVVHTFATCIDDPKHRNKVSALKKIHLTGVQSFLSLQSRPDDDWDDFFIIENQRATVFV